MERKPQCYDTRARTGQKQSDMSRLENAFGARLVWDGEDENSDVWIVW